MVVRTPSVIPKIHYPSINLASIMASKKPVSLEIFKIYNTIAQSHPISKILKGKKPVDTTELSKLFTRYFLPDINIYRKDQLTDCSIVEPDPSEDNLW
jgi:hypothetical protein